MKAVTLFAAGVLLAAAVATETVQANAQSPTVTREAALADASHLVDLLERVHPDPYSGLGGRVAFQRRVNLLQESVPDSGMSVAGFRELLARFLGDLGDGHTFVGRLTSSSSNEDDRFLPVAFTAGADGVFVSGTGAGLAHIGGALVARIAGQPVDSVARRIQTIFPRENMAGSRHLLARLITSRNYASLLIPPPHDSVTLDLLLPDGDSATVTLAYDLDLTARNAEVRPVRESGHRVDGLFGARMIAGDSIGYLKINTMWSREALESMQRSGRADLERWIGFVYDRYLHREAPEDRAGAIAGVPSLTGTVLDLLERMDEAGTSDLVVDLRGNDGGWSEILEPLLFALFGDSYLASPSPVFYATMISEEYLALNDVTLRELSRHHGRELDIGDVLFLPTEPPRTRQEFLDELRGRGAARLLEEYTPSISPRVYLVTDGGTFSAAFDLTYELWRFGATLVGVAPAQNPVAFVDVTEFALPNSGLTGSIARTAVVHPGIPGENGAVAVDYPMTWARFRERGFGEDAPLEAAVDLALRSANP